MTTTTPTPALADLDLLPCPFCGLGRAKAGAHREDCYFSLAAAASGPAIAEAPSTSDILVAWNRRAAQPVAPVQQSGQREGFEAAAKALQERAAGHFRNKNHVLQDECLQCASMLHDLKPVTTPSPQIAEVAELPITADNPVVGMLDELIHEITGDEGEDDPFTFLRRALVELMEYRRKDDEAYQNEVAAAYLADEARDAIAASRRAAGGEVAVSRDLAQRLYDRLHKAQIFALAGEVRKAMDAATPAPASAGQAAPMQSAAKKHRAQIAEVVHGTSLPPLERGELTLAIADLLDDALAAQPASAGQAAPADTECTGASLPGAMPALIDSWKRHSKLAENAYFKDFIGQLESVLAAQPAEGAPAWGKCQVLKPAEGAGQAVGQIRDDIERTGVVWFGPRPPHGTNLYAGAGQAGQVSRPVGLTDFVLRAIGTVALYDERSAETLAAEWRALRDSTERAAAPADQLDEAAAYRLWRDCEIADDEWFADHLSDHLPRACIGRAPTAAEWDAAMLAVMKDRATHQHSVQVKP